MAAGEQAVRVGGRRMTVTNLDKVLYPRTSTTKAEVLRYYATVAPALLPVLSGRPVTRKRWPNGVDAAPFFVKNLEPGAPGWIDRRTVPHSDRPVTYPLVDSVAALVWMAQMAALELHVPQWRFGDGGPTAPDRMVFDLDPGPGVSLADCAEVALLLREVLRQAGTDAVPVTSGSKGLHLYVALDGGRGSDEVSATARAVARSLEAEHPGTVTSKMAKSQRTGRVFLDWSQNNAAKTTVAPYSLRGREQPWVAAPRGWDELAAGDLQHLNLDQVLQRLADGIDPWRDHFGVIPVDGVAPADDGAAVSAVPDDEPDTAAIAGAAAYATAALGGSAHRGGGHRWQDPLEGPRGRVVRRDFSRPTTLSGNRSRRAGGSATDRPIGLPMLATAAEPGEVGAGAQWRFEGKWDGIRALAEVDGGALRLIGRSGRELTAGYPELAEIAGVVGDHSVLLDGEIVSLDADGRTSFPLLQRRMNLTSAAAIARAAGEVPVRYFAFDLLSVDGVRLLDKPYDDRRKLLTTLDPRGDHVEVPAALDGSLSDAMRFTRDQGWEGVVAKRADSVYRPGSRSRHWLKLKNQRIQEVVVIGWRAGRGRRTGGIGSLLMAVPQADGTLRYAGRVGTGFTDKQLDDLLAVLRPVRRCAADGVPDLDARDATWTEPTLVGEVSFLEWTPDHRLRAPSWRGVRQDKTPAEVRVES